MLLSVYTALLRVWAGAYALHRTMFMGTERGGRISRRERLSENGGFMEKRYESDRLRRRQREQRRKEIRRRKKRQALLRRIFAAGTGLVVLIVLLMTAAGRIREKETEQDKNSRENAIQELPPAEGQADGEDKAQKDTEDEQDEDSDTAESEKGRYRFQPAENMYKPGEDIISSHVIFVDVQNGTILAGRNETERMVPASMTKVLTLLVAAEHIQDLDEKYTITAEAAEYGFLHDLSSAGFEKGETVSVQDLLYGAILPSGADAALSLAVYVSGSQEAFAEQMNGKLEELGLSGSAHFTNCVGIYEENHYCTAYDMAVIMNAAIDNEVCREVLSAHTYTTSGTDQHPDGILLSNWFLRRIEDKDTGGEVLCGKTGYVDRSGSCAVSYGVSESGGTYICVTAGAFNKWKCINDHAALYKRFE